MVAQLETPQFDASQHPAYQVEGLLHVFTGPQRQFFTSVLARSLTVAAQGTPTLVVQFFKGGIGQGRDRPMQLGQNLDWLRCDLARDISEIQPEAGERQALQQLWAHAQQAIQQGQYGLVVLDELSLALQREFIPQAEVLQLLAQRPVPIELVLTGPQMPAAILERADRVTEVRRSHQP